MNTLELRKKLFEAMKEAKKLDLIETYNELEAMSQKLLALEPVDLGWDFSENI